MRTPLPCQIFSVISLGSALGFITHTRITHSFFFPPKHSDLGNPQFAKVVGQCELSECAFVPLNLVLQLAVKRIDNLLKGNPL